MCDTLLLYGESDLDNCGEGAPLLQPTWLHSDSVQVDTNIHYNDQVGGLWCLFSQHFSPR